MLVLLQQCAESVDQPNEMQSALPHAMRGRGPWEIMRVYGLVRGMQGLGARSRRDLLRKTWVPQGRGLRDLEEEKSVVIRFVVGYRCGAPHAAPALPDQLTALSETCHLTASAWASTQRCLLCAPVCALTWHKRIAGER